MVDEEFIWINEWPSDYAKKAYEQKHFIEAIQVLHGSIEARLQELLTLTGSVDFEMDIDKIYHISNQVNLSNCVRILFVLGQIEQKHYQEILKFNSMRNQIIHSLFQETFDDGLKKIPKKDFDAVFKKGLVLVEVLRELCEKKIE
jgi:DNA-binding MltR family transcriptional regulator